MASNTTFEDSEDKYQAPPCPPSDDEQEDFYFDEEEEEEYHQMLMAEKEKEKQKSVSGKTYSKEKMLHFRQQTILSIVQSSKGIHPFRFETRKLKHGEEDNVVFDSKVELALETLGSLDAVRKEFKIARKNKTVTVVRRNRSENAWIPGALAKHVNTPQKVRSEMIDILNKMTPEKYDKLFTQFFRIEGLQELENIRVLVRCILDKILLEKNFSDTYTRLCRDIANYPDFENRDFFKRILLQETQKEFEKGLNIDSTIVATSNDPDEYEEVEERKAIAKRKMLGNMRFIAELFKVKLLHPSIIIEILKDLFTTSGTPDPGNIEALCELLSSLGPHLHERLLDIVFTKLKQLANSPKYKTRIIFMIENLIELKEDNWVPRVVGR